MSDTIINKEVCEMRHRAIDARLKDHDEKLEVLQKSDATNTTEIKNICLGLEKQSQAIANQTKAIWGLVSSILLMLLGFLIWYIQQPK